MSLGLANPWGLLALAGVAAVVVIYLFRKRFRPRKISALFLWSGPAAWHQEGRNLSRPLYSRSFLLDLLAMILLSLALASPVWTTKVTGTLVIVLDSSLSMRASDNHEKARKQALALIEKKGTNDFIIIEAGSSVKVLVGKGASVEAAKKALFSYDPFEASDAIAQAIEEVNELTTDWTDVHIFTDKGISITPSGLARVTVHSLKGNHPNLAIVDASRFTGEKGENLNLTVGNFSNSKQSPRLLISSQGKEIYSDKIVLNPRERRRSTFSIEGVTGAVDISLQGNAHADELSADSKATLEPEADLTVKFQVDFLDQPTKDPFVRGLEASNAVYSQEDPDLMITRNPGHKGEVLTVIVPTIEPGTAALLGPFVVDSTHHLCEGLDLSGVYWPSDPNWRSSKAPLVSVGDISLYSFKSPDLLALNLMVGQSNITRLSSWPVMMGNLVRYVKQKLPGLQRVNYLPGQNLQFYPHHDIQLNPNGVKAKNFNKTYTTGSSSWRLPSAPGRYYLVRDQKILDKVHVNAIAPDESDLEQLSKNDQVRINLSTAWRKASKGTFSLGWLLVLIAMAALGINWLLSHRGAKS